MRISKTKFMENQVIFLAVFAFNLIIAYFLVFKFGYVAEEAIIRTGQALDLINGYNRGRQSLICSVWWLPLPTFIQLPLAFCRFHLHKLFLNNIISSFFAAGTIVFLNMLFKHCELDRLYRYLLLAVFQFTPLILFYSSNGTSQMIFVLFLVASLYYLLSWLKENGLRDFLFMTLNTSLLCLIRLEGFFYALAILAIVVVVSFHQKYQRSRKEGLLLLYLAPTGYLISLWFLFNWLIMGDLLYFLRGIFSGGGQLENPLLNFVIILPFVFILWAKFLELQEKNNHSYTLKKYIFLILLIASLFSGRALHLIKKEVNWAGRHEQEMAEIGAYLAKYKANSQVLVTDFQGYLFKYYGSGTYLLTHCFDFDLEKIPPGDEPVYLLVSRPEDKAGFGSIHWKYPNIYNEGTKFTMLDRDFATWRLFRVIRVDGKLMDER
ncbi:hypothetical protein KKC91_08225 [bacterium]|nr:hypothetical protein [bacterium]